MVVPNFHLSGAMALAGLAQFQKGEICKPQVGGSSSRQRFGANVQSADYATIRP